MQYYQLKLLQIFKNTNITHFLPTSFFTPDRRLCQSLWSSFQATCCGIVAWLFTPRQTAAYSGLVKAETCSWDIINHKWLLLLIVRLVRLDTAPPICTCPSYEQRWRAYISGDHWFKPRHLLLYLGTPTPRYYSPSRTRATASIHLPNAWRVHFHQIDISYTD